MPGAKEPWTVAGVGHVCHEWRMRQFGEQSQMRHALQICEEAGEVARAVGKSDEGIRADTRGNLADELGDVIMAAAAMAKASGIDIDEVLSRRLARMERLNFRDYPATGRPPCLG